MQHQLGNSADETDLATVWRLLCDGQAFLSDARCDAGRCFARLEKRSGPAVKPAYLEVLERVFLGESQKSLASELGVSVATIASYCTRTLTSVTPEVWVSRAPILLVMAALAARGAPLAPARYEHSLGAQGYVVSVEIPGATFRERLSDSEWQVARLSIEGQSHAGVAEARGTSLRTVANQLASVFAKLGVSGRSELRARAIHEHASYSRTLPPAPAVALPLMSLSRLGAEAWSRPAPLPIASSA
jgi:DNA-binding NarL/FixJ family response regulator